MTHVAIGYPKTPMMEKLHESSLRAGLRFVALPKVWDLPHIFTIDKFRIMRGFLEIGDISLNEIVMFTDAYDVLIIEHAMQILQKFAAMDADLVFNAECNLYPGENRDEVRAFFDRSDARARYLNSGCYIGFGWAIKEMLDYCLSRTTDNERRDHAVDGELAQDFYILAQQSDRLVVKLDSDSKIFATLGASADEYMLDHHSVINRSTGNSASVIHANGDKRNLVFLEHYANSFFVNQICRFSSLRGCFNGRSNLAYEKSLKCLRWINDLTDETVFFVTNGRRRCVAFTAQSGCLTFHINGEVHCSQVQPFAWEILSVHDVPKSAHGKTLNYYMPDSASAPIVLSGIPLSFFSSPILQRVQSYFSEYSQFLS